MDNKKVLFLLPGLFADATMWYSNVSELSKHFKVFALDMPNYGGKSKPSEKKINDISDYKKWFEQIISHYKLKKVSVAGISYGSWLALALARENPQIIEDLILLDPSVTFMPMSYNMAWKGFWSFMFFPNREKYQNFFQWLNGEYSDSQMTVWLEHIINVVELGSVGMFDIPQHRVYTKKELAMINMPVLIMASGKLILYDDPQIFKQNALKALPLAEILIIPEAGHGLNIEKSGYVNKKIIHFLKN
jgi:pimeloyl-ACP methyl ester carboxylesterase